MSDVTGATCPILTQSAFFENTPTTLLALPRELLEQIFLYLDAQDVRKCTLVSRRINDFTRSSLVLRHRLACDAAGVVDNPYCKFSVTERYDALMKREKAWRRFQPVFTKMFDDVHEPSFPTCSLTSSVYLYGEYCDREDCLRYCFLPSTPDDVLRWTTIVPRHAPFTNWNHGKDSIRRVGMAVDEHDLVVNVISSDNYGPGQSHITYSMYMTIIQFSTGEYHPLAHRPQIHVQDYERGHHVTLEIAGDNIALLVDTHRMEHLFIFNWKTGHKRLQHQTSNGVYSSIAFVSPEILLVPNVIEGQYDVWKIPKEDSVPYQVLGLRFPALSKEHYIVRLDHCGGRPDPHNVLRTSPKPFHISADETMIMTIVTISSMSQTHFFAHFMRRRSLLETIISLIRTGVPPSFNVWHQSNQAVINYDDSGMPCSFSFSITGLQEASSHREVYGVRSIPWSEWGPPISRWLDAGDMTRSWTITPIGQRWLRLDPVDDGDEIYRFSVIDFNPYNIYNPQDDLPGELVVGRKGDYFDHHNVFVEEIEMGLNCITYTAPEVYSGYDMWLMDDENVLALKSVENQDIWGGDIIEKMAVFHFG